MNAVMSSRHTINPLLLIQSFTPTQAASCSTAPQTSVRSVCSSTTDRISFEDPLPSEAATPTRPSPTLVPSSFSFSSLHSLQLSPSCSRGPSSGSSRPTPFHSPGPSSGFSRPTPSYSPGPSSGFSRPTPSHSPGPSSGSSCPTPSYSPYPSPSYSPQQSSSCSPTPASARKRRRPASTNTDAITELVTVVREDLNKQDRDREEARNTEQNLLEVLREFLSHNRNGTQNP